MHETLYHKILRVSAVVVALVLVFDSGIVTPFTRVLSDRTVEYLASSAVGMQARVPENEINVISGELAAWERDLSAREEALRTREIPARDFGVSSDNNISTYVLSLILFILTILILLNYALDWQRVRLFKIQLKGAE